LIPRIVNNIECVSFDACNAHEHHDSLGCQTTDEMILRALQVLNKNRVFIIIPVDITCSSYALIV